MSVVKKIRRPRLLKLVETTYSVFVHDILANEVLLYQLFTELYTS